MWHLIAYKSVQIYINEAISLENLKLKPKETDT